MNNEKSSPVFITFCFGVIFGCLITIFVIFNTLPGNNSLFLTLSEITEDSIQSEKSYNEKQNNYHLKNILHFHTNDKIQTHGKFYLKKYLFFYIYI